MIMGHGAKMQGRYMVEGSIMSPGTLHALEDGRDNLKTLWT